jgi:SAM-dependent methyltransferase
MVSFGHKTGHDTRENAGAKDAILATMGETMSEPDWRTANRANWDERVAIHLGPRGYDLSALRKGHGTLGGIVEPELPAVSGKRVLHLQCHFGKDTLTLAQRGAEVVGLDFSAPAIAAARSLTEELGLGSRARFVQADLYDALTAVPEPHGFDLVYVTWGALCWLPDIRRWAEIVAHFIKPGGSLYLAESHPAAMVFDDRKPLPDGKPGFDAPYFLREPLVEDDPRDYSDEVAQLKNTRQYTFMHPLGSVVTGLIEAGLTLDWLHEHDGIAWRVFDCLVKDITGTYRWPDRPWLPLAYSLLASRRKLAK